MKLARRLGAIAAAAWFWPLGVLTALCIAEPPTLWGAAYLAGALALTAGLLTAPWRITRARGFVRGSAAWLAAVLALRLLVTGDGASLRAVTLPSGKSARLVNRIFEEQDVSLLAGRLLQWVGFIRASEVDGFLPALRGIYRDMRAAEGATPSPFAATYLGLQRADAFDAILVEPPGQPKGAVIFLHGFAGNFAELCWQFAQASREADLLTVCPSVSRQGDWWSKQGAATVRATLDWLHASRKLDRVYLAGLSNGGVGASVLAPRFAPELDGLLLLSGADFDARKSGLPTFVLASDRDIRVGADGMRAYAEANGAKYVELKGGHFVFAEQAETCRKAIADWLVSVSSR